MVSLCYCVVCAVRLQFKILWQGYIEKNKKNFMFYRRIITRRYFTESWKKFTELSHTHRQLYWRTLTRRYFTESCKKITGLCHNHRRYTDGVPDVQYRRNDQWIHAHPEAHACLTYVRLHKYRRHYRRKIPTESPTELRTSRSARMCDTCPSAQIPTDWKVWRDFQTFLVRISINFWRYYRQTLMPPTTINFRW